MRKLTYLMVVREAAQLFNELADEIIDRRASAARIGKTHIEFCFGPEERGYTIEDLADRVLRPAMTLMVTVISRDHKRICGSTMMLSIPDGWSGHVIYPPNGIPVRLTTDPERESTRLSVLYGTVEQIPEFGIPNSALEMAVRGAGRLPSTT